jgi:integrase
MPSTAKNPNETETQPTFAKVGQNLYRLQSTDGYYGLVKRGDKQFRRSLKTKDRKLAERRLTEMRSQVANLTITDESDCEFRELADRWLETVQHSMKESTVVRRQLCIRTLAPFFEGVPVRRIAKSHCERWVIERGSKIASSTFAAELDCMRLVFDYALAKGLILSNSAHGIKRKKIRTKEICIPSRDQFEKLIAAIRESDGRADSQRKAKPGADFVELLAYSGCRLSEAGAILWRDVDFDKNTVTVTGGEKLTKNSEIRVIPMTAALADLLTRLKRVTNPKPAEPISPIKDAKKCLQTACRRLSFPRFTHHDFRHFFATTCIESGVDIPTVSRWLGHKDGGALCMKTYGHLRDEHSASMIKRVNFHTPSQTDTSRNSE